MTYQPPQAPYGAAAPSGYPPNPWFVVPPPPRRRRGLVVAAIAAGVAVVVAVAGILLVGTRDKKPTTAAAAVVAVVAPQKLEVTGSMTLHDGFQGYSSGCAGEGGYSDIADGAGVTVTDASGAVIGLGRLAGSQVTAADECELSFAVNDVPAGKGFYGLEVSHRGSLKYAEADLASPIALTLGS